MKIILSFLITLIFFNESTCNPSEGLYSINDNVTILTAENFNETIFESSYIWIVEFYASWCGHCQAFAPTFKAFAKDIVGWQSVLRIGVVNCPDESNKDLCRKMTVRAYPTLRVFPPFSNSSYPGENINKGDRNVKFLRDAALKNVERYLDKVSWTVEGKEKPTFELAIYEDVEKHMLSTSDPFYFALVFESPSSSDIGKQIILDTSSCSNITTRRIFSDSDEAKKIMVKFSLELSEFPSVVVIKRGGGVQEIEVEIRKRSFYTYKLQRLPGVGDPEPLAKQGLIHSESSSVSVDWREVDRGITYMADIESGLRYALTVEVASVKLIEEEALEALRSFIGTMALLSNYFPVRTPTCNFLVGLNAWLAGREQIGFEEWQQRMNEKQRDSYLPDVERKWVGCSPSVPELRGYPCSIWTLFHSLTVAFYNAKEKDIETVPRAMEGYVASFFGCRECSANFAKELISNPYEDIVQTKEDLVLWLWRLHNQVNKRLHGDISEDPHFPKVQFPPPDLCPACRTPNGIWKEDEVVKYLVGRYSASKVSMKYLDTAVVVSKAPSKKPQSVDDLILDANGVADDINAKFEEENDFDAGDDDSVYEKQQEGQRSHNKIKTDEHPVLVQEHLEDRRKAHPLDEAEEFGGQPRSIYPRDLALSRWHSDNRLQLGFSGFDTSICVILWGTSIISVLLLYCYMQKYRKITKYCKV